MTIGREPEQQRVAAEFQQAAAVVVGDCSMSSKLCPMSSEICSAPSRPLRASASDSLVNPEMSTNTALPSLVQIFAMPFVDQMLLQHARDIAARLYGVAIGVVHLWLVRGWG